MKILFAGKRGFKYNRTQVLLSGLKKLEDVEVIEFEYGHEKGDIRAHLKELDQEVDFVFVPSFRHKDVGFIKKNTTKPLIFDPLISNYLTKVVDYGHYWKAPFKYFSDYFPFKKCDLLIADTEAHRQHFHRMFRIPLEKIVVVPVGVDTSKFKPETRTDNPQFLVGFYGSFVPLQGADKIIEAANLLRDEPFQFELIGTGATFKRAEELVKKYQLMDVTFSGWVDYDQLSARVNQFDLCLGIFGDSLKADSVVPNKIFHYAALAKPILTKNTPGIQEIFESDVDIKLCSNDPAEIARNILEMKDDQEKMNELGEAVFNKVQDGFNEMKIASRLIEGIRDQV